MSTSFPPSAKVEFVPLRSGFFVMKKPLAYVPHQQIEGINDARSSGGGSAGGPRGGGGGGGSRSGGGGGGFGGGTGGGGRPGGRSGPPKR